MSVAFFLPYLLLKAHGLGWGQLIIIFLCVNIYIVEWRDFGQVGSSSGKKGRSTLKFIILKKRQEAAVYYL